MDSVSSAVSFARALLVLARSNQSGVLHVRCELGACRLSMAAGLVRAVSGVPGSADALGDTLLRSGALDAGAHARALGVGRVRAPVGRWLIESGLATRGAVAIALRSQVRERVLRLLACESLDYRFEAGAAALGESPPIEEPMETADLVLIALRTRLKAWSIEGASALVPPGALRFNVSGRFLVRDAALWPEEVVAAALIADGATLSEVSRATRGAERATRFIAALVLLSALTHEPLANQRFSLLLRKREQLKRHTSARALLDLPRDAAPGDARKALRRLARALHPDVLGPDVNPALREASSEVMRALIDAERSLRTHGASAR